MADEIGLSLENILARIQSTEEAVAKVVSALIDEKFIYFLTDLDHDEMEGILLLRLISNITGNQYIEDFINKYLVLKVAIKGERASMITALASGLGMQNILGQTKKGQKPPSLSV